MLYNNIETAPQTLPKLYQLAKKQVYRALEKQKTVIKLSDSDKLKISKSLPACINYILKERPKKSAQINFNKLILILITYFQMADWNKTDIWAMVEPFIKGYSHSETYDTPEKRSEHWRKEWHYLKSNSDYTFDCSYVKGLRLPGKAFNCSKCIYLEKIQSNYSSAETIETLGKDENRDLGLKKDLGKHFLHEDIIPVIDKIAEKNLPIVDIYDELEPLKKELAAMPPAKAVGYLDYIKKKLKIKNNFIEQYKKEITSLRKEDRKAADIKPPKAKLSALSPGLVEIVWNDDHVAYLLRHKDQIKIDRYNSNELGNRITPPDVEYIPYPLLSPESILAHKDENNDKLYFDVFERLEGIAILSNIEQYHLCTVYIFFTYLSDAVQYFPYLWFYGVPERGKSRMVKAIINLSYRGLYTETLNEAYLFRYADLFHGTIGIDVYNLSKKALKKGSLDLLLGRSEKGMKVARVLAVDKGDFKDTKYFDVYGPTILATNTDISPQNPLRSRCIKITMPEVRGFYPNNNRHEDLVDLKKRLYAFKLRHIGNSLPEVDKPIAGRLGDIIHPLLCVAALLPKEASEGLIQLFEQFERDRRDAEAESLAGRIAQAISDLKDEVRNGRLPVKKVREKLNEDTNEKYHIAPQTIGRELSAMDIPKINKGGEIFIIWDEEKIHQIFSRYLEISSSSSCSSYENMTNMTNMIPTGSGKEKNGSYNQLQIPSVDELKKLKMTEEQYRKLIKK